MQPLLPAERLQPVAAECLRQLRQLLVAPSHDDADASGLSLGAQAGGSGGAQPPAIAQPIPGLSADETAAVLALAEAFAAPEAGSGARSAAPLDAAATQFVTAVGVACASEQPAGDGSAQQQAQQAQQPQRVTVMNAAGVAFTLAPSAVVRPSQDGNGDGDSGSVARRWGLLPGLDAGALLWALLSGAPSWAAGGGSRRCLHYWPQR